MDVNFNPNNMPLSMRSGIKKSEGNVGNLSNGVTNKAPIDTNALYAEAMAADNNEQMPDVMRGEEKNFNNWKDFDKEWDKDKIEEGDWGTVGKEQYVVIKREDGTLDVLVHDPDDSMGPRE